MGKMKKKSIEKEKKMRSQKISLKILLPVAFMIMVCFALVIIYSGLLRSMNQVNETIVNKQVKEIEEISDIANEFSNINGKVLTHILQTNNAQMDNLEKEILAQMDTLNDQVDAFDLALPADDSRREEFTLFQENLVKYEKTAQSMMKTSRTNKEQASVSASSNFGIFSDKTAEYINGIIMKTNENLELVKQESQDYKTKISTYTTVACVILLCLTILTVFIIMKAVVRPIKQATKQINGIMSEIEGGHCKLDKRITVMTKDEIGRLILGMNKFLDLMDNLIGNITTSCGELSMAQSSVLENVSGAKVGVESTSAAMEELAAGMEEVTASIVYVNQETKNIGSSVEEIQNQATSGTEYAMEIQNRAEQIDQTVKKSRQEVSDIVSDIDASVMHSVEKGKKIKKIEELTEEILDISSQTNLLALNASIEAARAGEAGKGFAVVAEEIRNLADHSKDTANYIQNINSEVVESVEDLAKNALRLLEFVNARVLEDYDNYADTGRQYLETSQKVSVLMKEFLESTKHLHTVMDNVSHANDDVTKTIEESNTAIADVVDNINVLSGDMEQVLKASGDVGMVVTNLQTETRIFI